MLVSGEMKNRLELWRRLMARSEEDLNSTQVRLTKVRNEGKKLAAQKDKLNRMKYEYAKSLFSSCDQKDAGRRQFITRNFITHLDKTLSSIDDQIILTEANGLRLKQLYDKQYRKFKKFESLHERGIKKNDKDVRRQEEKIRDAQNVLDFSRKVGR